MKILDLIDPARSDIRYKRFTFPDGQPHFELLDPLRPQERVEVLCRIKCAADLVDVAMALDVLRRHTRSNATLNIAYMLGARMDRRIDERQPFTLAVLATMLRPFLQDLDSIRVLDPHSEKTLSVLSDSVTAEPIHPDRLVKLALQHYGADATIVIPDEGAIARTSGIMKRLGLTNQVARCVKKRDSATGALSGFALVEGDVSGKRCLIVDDICDGGGTFAGIAAVLRDAGAASVALCATHGIFSKGVEIAGIDTSYCTDSFQAFEDTRLRGELLRAESFCDVAFVSYSARDGRPLLYVLPDFVRDHVRGLG